tara:strand:- start:16514 stop:16726 length:213 start_codon:yes stop_codon:yes gene_type:complete
MVVHYKGVDNKTNNKPFISSIEDELGNKNLEHRQILISILEIISYDDFDGVDIEEKIQDVIELCNKGLKI